MVRNVRYDGSSVRRASGAFARDVPRNLPHEGGVTVAKVDPVYGVLRRRPLDASSPNTYKWLKSLECFETADRLIKDGHQLMAVADFIVGQVGEENLPMTRRGLYEMLKDYRMALPLSEAVRGHSSRFLDTIRRRIDEGLDELTELAGLYELQLARLEDGMKQEEASGRTLREVTRNVEVAGEILERSAKIKVAFGAQQLGAPLPDVIDDESKMAIPKETRVMRLLSDPETRRRAAEMLERLGRLDKAVGLDKVREKLRVIQGGAETGG